MRNVANYGVDAPGIVLGLAAAGGAGVAVRVALGWTGGVWLATSCLLTAALMVWSSTVGKRVARERVLDLRAWRGDERVLDVGCGRGLMLHGAARRLTTGRAVGVDLWLRRDQSGNHAEATLVNAGREGVRERVAVTTGDMRALPFPDASFDVVVSNLAIHNVPTRDGREAAVREIARVLRPGGQALLQDIAHTDEYAATLRAAAMGDVTRSGLRFWIFPPVRVVTARKPA